MSIQFSSSVDHSIESVFSWHEKPGALTRLVPPWSGVRPLQETGSLANGRAVLRLPGGLRWVAQHRDFDPPNGFVDDLISLPLPWHHVHSFAATGPVRTRITDTVTTPVPASFLHAMFAYRHIQLRDDLAVQSELHRLHSAPCTIAVTGSSGLVGTALCAFLTTAGHRVIRLVRGESCSDDERTWKPDDPDPRMFEGVHAVVHLAGASIAGRFTQGHKRAIAMSRFDPTRKLAEAMAHSGAPRVLVSASAIGFYGPDRGDELLDEGSGRGTGFLSDVVEAWEVGTHPARAAGLRVVTIRTGIALSARGGMLKLVRPVFQAGLGGRIGDGRQWLSWIDLDDLTDVYAQALVDERFDGAVNAVAPTPVRNQEFTATLARVLHRPALFPVPTAAIAVAVGNEGVREVAAASQRVAPSGLERVDFRFRRPALEASLRHQLGRLEPTP
jgi:uncharacterized protein